MITNTNDRRIDYVEFNVADIERSKEFYGGAFGWTFKDYGPQYCEFSDGRLTGGFTTTAPVSSKGGPLVILYAADIEDVQRRIEAAGKGEDRDADLAAGGRRFHFTDPDGYELAVWSKN